MSNTLINQLTTTSRPFRPSYLRSFSSSTQKNKPRLYLALYARGGSISSFTAALNCDAYHWALIIGPQTSGRQDPGTRYHVVHSSGAQIANRGRASIIEDQLAFESDELGSSIPARAILVRLTVAKVKDVSRVAEILRAIEVPENDPGFSCLTWVRRGFRDLHDDGACLRSYLDAGDWNEVEAKARNYCKRKRDERRANGGVEDDMPELVSTWNFWENREVTP